MSDIVTRLRKWSVFGYGYEASCDMKEAATAIEVQSANMANAARLLSEQTAEITRLRINEASFRRHTLKTERWRGALMNIAQGKGDPVAVACAALELDND